MPSTSKPPSYPLWTTGDASQVAAPTPAQAASGYTAGQRPAFQLLNWQFWQTGLWLSYLDSAVNGSSLTTSLDPLLRLLGGGQWSWNATTGVLAWSAPFVLQVPGLPDSANQMAAGSVMLSDGQVAYFTANVPFDATATTAAGSSELTQLSYELGVQVGQAVSGSGIAAGTTVVGVSDGVVTHEPGGHGFGIRRRNHLRRHGQHHRAVGAGQHAVAVAQHRAVCSSRRAARGGRRQRRTVRLARRREPTAR